MHPECVPNLIWVTCPFQICSHEIVSRCHRQVHTNQPPGCPASQNARPRCQPQGKFVPHLPTSPPDDPAAGGRNNATKSTQTAPPPPPPQKNTKPPQAQQQAQTWSPISPPPPNASLPVLAEENQSYQTQLSAGTK